MKFLTPLTLKLSLMLLYLELGIRKAINVARRFILLHVLVGASVLLPGHALAQESTTGADTITRHALVQAIEHEQPSAALTPGTSIFDTTPAGATVQAESDDGDFGKCNSKSCP